MNHLIGGASVGVVLSYFWMPGRERLGAGEQIIVCVGITFMSAIAAWGLLP